MAIKDGKYKARAVDQVLGTIGEKGTPVIEVMFEIGDGDNKGGRLRWSGWLSEKAAARTIEGLQTCGWRGEDLGEFSDGQLHGLDKNEVEIVVELEEYEDKEGNKRTAPRVQWVNKFVGLNIKNAMAKEEAASFGEKMKGLVLKMKSKQPPSEAAEFPFGVNAEQPKKAGGTKAGF